MKLPNFKRLFKADFKTEYQELIEKLAFSINDGFSSVYEALNKKISLQDNIQCTVKDLEVTVDSNGVPKNTTSMTIETTGRVLGTTVLKAENQVNSSVYPSGAVFINFTQSDKTIIITHITGLQADNKYLIKVVAFG